VVRLGPLGALGASMRRHGLLCLALAGLALPLYLIGSPRTGYQGTDELRYAQVAKEIGSGARFFMLHFNGRPYTEKPPLYFWLVRGAFELFGGPSAFALRLPGVASAIASLLVVYALAFSLFRRRDIAWTAALLLLVVPRFVWISRWGRLDIPMCLAVYAALLCFVRAYFSGRRPLAGWPFWLWIGLALAVKGPVGPIVALGTIVTFLLWQGEWARLKELWSPRGLGLALGLNLAWLAPMMAATGAEASRDLIVRQNLGRVLDPWRHVEPLGYYLKNIWYDAAPAALFVAAGAGGWLWAWGRSRRRRPEAPAAGPIFGDQTAACRFLMGWIGLTLIGLSFYPPKRAQYLLPAYPALAILAAFLLQGFMSGREGAWKLPRATGLVATPAWINLGALALVWVVLMWRHELAQTLASALEPIDLEASVALRDANAEFEYAAWHFSRPAQVIGSIVLAATVGAGALLIVRRAFAAALGLMIALLYAGWFVLFGWMIPPAFQDDDLKAMSRDLADRLGEHPQLQIAMFGDDKPYFNIYGDFVIAYFEDEDFEEDFRRLTRETLAAGRPLLLLIDAGKVSRFRDEPWLHASVRRDLTLRGDRIAIFEWMEPPAEPSESPP